MFMSTGGSYVLRLRKALGLKFNLLKNGVHNELVRPHCQHRIYLPDDVPHLVDDVLQVSVLDGDLLHQLVMLLQRALVPVPPLLLQLCPPRILVFILQRDQRLYWVEVHSPGVLLALLPAHCESLEQEADAVEDILQTLLFLQVLLILNL